MYSRIPDRPPRIVPLANDVDRPLWSVMIPTYNCINYLRETLASVLAQDPGVEKMQIEVVDDCSTDGDVQALVQEVGKGRVGYYRQEMNRGSLRNFETCLNRSKGKWVHLLHGDDMVRGKFYQEIETMFTRYPEAGAAFTRHTIIGERGESLFDVKPLLKEPGLLPDWLYTIGQRNRLQTPAIVVKRSVYEQVGGFFAAHYGEDWEMWTRIASRFPVAYSPECLAMYRKHSNSISNSSFLTGQNIKDLTRVIHIIPSYFPEEKRRWVIKRAKKNISKFIARTARRVFDKHNDPYAAFVQAKGALKIDRNITTLVLVSLLFVEYVLHRFKHMVSSKYEVRQPVSK